MAQIMAGNKGQSSLPEYVVTFFIVIATVVAMTVYIQRSIQAKVKDGRDYMVSVASQSDACDASCRAAAGISGSGIPREYEPYYGKTDSHTSRNSSVSANLIGGADRADRQFYRNTEETVETNSVSSQLPPGAAAGDQYGK